MTVLNAIVVPLWLLIALGCTRHSTAGVVEGRHAKVVSVNSLSDDVMIIFEDVKGDSAKLDVFKENSDSSRSYIIKDYLYQGSDSDIIQILQSSNHQFKKVLIYTNHRRWGSLLLDKEPSLIDDFIQVRPVYVVFTRNSGRGATAHLMTSNSGINDTLPPEDDSEP